MLDDIDSELAGSDLMIHPSIEEPFGIAVLEGMRAGLPIVASRVGGIPEVVGEDDVALMARPGSPDSLVNAVSKLAGDADLRAYMGQRARRRFEMEFQAETMLERIENYLKSIAREAAHGKA
jgi:glycosyltransferase involved in cell wall biosynthesis